MPLRAACFQFETLFVAFAFVLDPPIFMPTCWIVMRPVEDSASIVPFVLTKDPDDRTYIERHTRGEINVVRDKH